MKDVIFLLLHLITTLAKLIQPGGSRAVVVENDYFSCQWQLEIGIHQGLVVAVGIHVSTLATGTLLWKHLRTDQPPTRQRLGLESLFSAT